MTGADGVFAATGLAAGQYTVRLDLPDGLAGEVWPKTIDLVDARGCAEVQGEAFADGRVSGQVVDAAARPIAGLTVELRVPAGLDAALGPEPLRALTDAAGRYEISRVPAGRFVIGINTRRDGEGRLSEPRLFLPGVASLASATRVRVAEGERVTVENFVVPGAFRFVSLTGVVFDASGTPAANARVYLKGPAESDYLLGEPVVTGPDGRFTLAAVAGRSYRLFAERPARCVSRRADRLVRAGDGGRRARDPARKAPAAAPVLMAGPRFDRARHGSATLFARRCNTSGGQLV